MALFINPFPSHSKTAIFLQDSFHHEKSANLTPKIKVVPLLIFDTDTQTLIMEPNKKNFLSQFSF
jgi:hypothetical protein